MLVSCIVFTSIAVACFLVLFLNEVILTNKLSTEFLVRIIGFIAIIFSHVFVLNVLKKDVSYFSDVTQTTIARSSILPICMALILASNVFGQTYLIIFTVAAINPEIFKN